MLVQLLTDVVLSGHSCHGTACCDGGGSSIMIVCGGGRHSQGASSFHRQVKRR